MEKECKLESKCGVFIQRMTKTSEVELSEGKVRMRGKSFRSKVAVRCAARSWNAVSVNRCLTKKVCVNRVLLRSRCRSNYGPFIRQSTRCLNENKRWETSYVSNYVRDFSFLLFHVLSSSINLEDEYLSNLVAFPFFFFSEEHCCRWNLLVSLVLVQNNYYPGIFYFFQFIKVVCCFHKFNSARVISSFERIFVLHNTKKSLA